MCILLTKLIISVRSGVDIVHIQNNADIAVAQDRAAGNAVILDMELLQIRRQRFDHDLVLTEQAQQWKQSQETMLFHY